MVKGDRCCLPDGNYHLSFVHYHLINGTKITPRKTVVSVNVRQCPSLSLNVLIK